jgi:hypothetical protein
MRRTMKSYQKAMRCTVKSHPQAMRRPMKPNRNFPQAMRSPMQSILLCITLIIFAGLLPAQSLSWRQRLEPIGAPPWPANCPEPDQYVHVITDEFDKGHLDQWFWNPDILGFNHTPNSSITSEWCSISSLTFPPNTGLLRIMATDAPIDTSGISWMPPGELLTDSMPNRRVWPFQSGALTAKWGLEKGRYVLRSQIAPGKDLWPAFWLFGDCADEIDIFEFQQTESDVRHDKFISCSVHTELVCGEDINPDTKSYNLHQDVTTALHTYGVEWDDYRIRFFTDGNVKRTVYHYYRRRTFAGIVSYKPLESCDAIQSGEVYYQDPQFTNAMLKVIINLAIRKGAPANQSPKHMDLEYFQFDEPMDCQETKTLEFQSDIAGADFYARYGDRTITAGEIVVDPNTTMTVKGPAPTGYWNPGDLLVLTAAEEIRILPGFDVNYDGNFIGQIRPCTQNKQPDESLQLPKEEPSEEMFFLGDSLLDLRAGILPAGNAEEPIRLFPNPAQDQVQLIGTKADDHIVLRDALGRLLPVDATASEETTHIAVDALAPGLYFLQVWRGEWIVGNLRFVKERK